MVTSIAIEEIIGIDHAVDVLSRETAQLSSGSLKSS